MVLKSSIWFLLRSQKAHTALWFYVVKPQAYAFKIFDFNQLSLFKSCKDFKSILLFSNLRFESALQAFKKIIINSLL